MIKKFKMFLSMLQLARRKLGGPTEPVAAGEEIIAILVTPKKRRVIR